MARAERFDIPSEQADTSPAGKISLPSRILWILLFQCGAVLFQLAFIHNDGFITTHVDLEIYHRYSELFLSGRIPYLDFRMEYPPLALLAFAVPNLIHFGNPLGSQAYNVLFLLENMALGILTALAVLDALNRRSPRKDSVTRGASIFALSIAFLSPLAAWRYDLFPALLTILAYLYLVRNKPSWSGIFLGLGIAAKLYPAILVPVFALYLFTTGQAREWIRFGTGLIATLSATLVPFFLIDPGWLGNLLAFHQGRNLQIESVASGVLMLGHLFLNTKLEVALGNGCYEVFSRYSDLAIKILPFAAIAGFGIVLAACYFRFIQERHAAGTIGQDTLAAFSVLALLVFILTGKVFSPQYLIWLSPLIPLLRLRHSGSMLGAAFLTLFMFTVTYKNMAGLHAPGILLLNIRNGLLVAAGLWLLADYFPWTRRRKLE
jgi:hypothetical protein